MLQENKIKSFSINEQGYGTIPKAVMQCQDISIMAKAVYAYFCSYTGAGSACFPSQQKICFDLEISKNSLNKYLRELKEAGLVEVEQEKSNGKFARNVYTLTDTKLPYTKIADTEDFVHGNLNTKNNSIKSNSILKSNSNKKKERKTTGYDDILSSVTDTSLRDLYLDYIKMRKLIKSPMTDRALQMLINKVNELEPDSVERQKKLLETAILNNWKSVYPLKGDEGSAVSKGDSREVQYGTVL